MLNEKDQSTRGRRRAVGPGVDRKTLHSLRSTWIASCVLGPTTNLGVRWKVEVSWRRAKTVKNCEGICKTYETTDDCGNAPTNHGDGLFTCYLFLISRSDWCHWYSNSCMSSQCTAKIDRVTFVSASFSLMNYHSSWYIHSCYTHTYIYIHIRTATCLFIFSFAHKESFCITFFFRHNLIICRLHTTLPETNTPTEQKWWLE